MPSAACSVCLEIAVLSPNAGSLRGASQVGPFDRRPAGPTRRFSRLDRWAYAPPMHKAWTAAALLLGVMVAGCGGADEATPSPDRTVPDFTAEAATLEEAIGKAIPLPERGEDNRLTHATQVLTDLAGPVCGMLDALDAQRARAEAAGATYGGFEDDRTAFEAVLGAYDVDPDRHLGPYLDLITRFECPDAVAYVDEFRSAFDLPRAAIVVVPPDAE